MNGNKKMSSIARKINSYYWYDKFASYLAIDILMILTGIAVFVNFDNEEVEAMIKIALRGFSLIILFQIISLIVALFGARRIRRTMRPLNELAQKAEQISRYSFDPNTKFKNLESAIENFSPELPGSKISTGDKDLKSIEVAINNMLNHMRESQKQQSRFVSDASHELRTPIAVIQGYVNMLDRWGKEDESVLEESIEALKHESEHMKELVEQLLFLARGDSGRNTLNKADMNLYQVMNEVFEESLMIDEKHTYKFSGNENGEYRLVGDVAMIKQSARIFVQNAAKYSKEGDVIQIKVQEDEESVSYVIQDEGIGMKENEVNHIFERFYRSDEARNGENGGSGLGLSIAKWIIDAHNGVVDVLSVSGIGTRFTVKFFKKQIS